MLTTTPIPPPRSNLDGKEDASQMECPRRRNITYKETGEIWFMTVRVMRLSDLLNESLREVVYQPKA